jgi:CRP-like cAMP-binding protein
MADTQHNLEPFLARLGRRSVLSAAEQQAVLDLPFRLVRYEPNHDLVRLGERVDHACFVAEGLVGRFDQNARGDRQITSLYIPGDMPDLLSVVQPKATSALVALSRATVLHVPHREIRQAMAIYPALAEAFWRDCMVDSMILAQWVVNVGRRNARARMAHLLCEMGYRYGFGREKGGAEFRFAMTQSQLADATGITPVHVNRTLMALIADGVSMRAKKVRIADWDALAIVGDFDSGYLQEDINPQERLRIVQPA